MSKVQGVDVSGWQSVGGSDYAMAPDNGDEFVIVKLSQGQSVSKKGLLHADKALHDGLPTGAYHFAAPYKRDKKTKQKVHRFDPHEEADTFCDAIEESGLLDHPWEFVDEHGEPVPRLWLDMEWISFKKDKAGKKAGKAFRKAFNHKKVMEFTRIFIGHVQDRLGVPCGIYTGRSYCKYRYRNCEELAVYALWLAAYVKVGKDRDNVPKTVWPDPIVLKDGTLWAVLIWQFTGKGSVPWYREGVGKIDRNLLKVA